MGLNRYAISKKYYTYTVADPGFEQRGSTQIQDLNKGGARTCAVDFDLWQLDKMFTINNFFNAATPTCRICL